MNTGSNNSDATKITYDMNPLTKAVFGFVGALLTSLTIATFTQVSSSNIEIVKVQSELSSLKERIITNKDISEEKVRDLNTRISGLETRVSNLEAKRH